MSGTAVGDKQRAFTGFVEMVEPRLRRALVALRGREAGRDATAEALLWAWEHWGQVETMVNPVGYLYRVGVSHTRNRRRQGFALAPGADDVSFEPGLAPALARLTARQRAAVVLVHGCGWTYEEVAEALELSKSSVGSHVERGMARLRREMGVRTDG